MFLYVCMQWKCLCIHIQCIPFRCLRFFLFSPFLQKSIRTQTWLLQVHVSRKKNLWKRHSKASIPKRGSGWTPRFRYSFTGALLIDFCHVILLSTVWTAPQRRCYRRNGSPGVCRITTTVEARLRPTKSLWTPTIQTTASFHCCSQEKKAQKA